MAEYYDEGSGLWYTIPDEELMVGGPTPPPVGGSAPGNPGGAPVTNPPPSPPSTSAPADPAAQTVIDYYNQYLGRPPQPGDVEKWLSGQYGHGDRNNLAGIATGIRMSDEGAQYSSQHTTPANTDPYTGFQTTGNDYSAFNAERQQDPEKSAKDAFVMLSNRAPAPPLGNKAAMAEWFKKYIQPGMNNLGHVVSSVNGDSFSYSNHEGSFTVDYAENAGGPAGAGRRLQWNAQAGDAATAARYGGSLPAGAGGGGGAGGAGGGGGSGFSGSGGFGGLDLPHYEPYPEWHPTEWVPPKPEDVKNDPAYQFRYEEGLRPIVNQRALQGLTRGGATMKALERYGSDFASDEFGRIYDRAANDWTMTNNASYKAWTGNAGEHNNAYDNWTNEAQGEWNADWDVYQYQNDQAFNYWNAKLGAATQGSQFGNDEP